MGLGDVVKSAAAKSLVIKINLTFLAVFLVVYITLLVQPPRAVYDKVNVGSAVRCSSRECLKKKAEEGMGKKMILREKKPLKPIPAILNRSLRGEGGGRPKIGLVNVGPDDGLDWGSVGGEAVGIEYESVSGSMEWKDLFPEWIDEEEENEGMSCPEVPMPDLSSVVGDLDVVVARVRCRQAEEGWSRDVGRLQAHMAAAKAAAERGRRDGRGRVRVAVESECRPMMEVFACDDVVGREGMWWLFEVDAEGLRRKMALPVGSCMLSMPLWQPGNNEQYDPAQLAGEQTSGAPDKEAYATVLHSSDLYVCGAIVLAQSILKTGTARDLVLLHDSFVPAPKLAALAAAGWKLRVITRIRNPRAETGSYNEYNYSKLRLWQLTEYRKIVFIDADIIVLRSLDVLFRFPQVTAVGNDGVIFNSGIMVIEPSNCTFKTLMKRRYDVVSYNGGDQGFLNEVFVWWHRVPRRVNFLKNFWSNDSGEAAVKNAMFGSDPPQLYAIHYLGLKPWVCHRQYDCNWNVADKHVYASDEAHGRWWGVHDSMAEGLKGFCGLSAERKGELERERRSAEELGVGNGHWRIKTD